MLAVSRTQSLHDAATPTTDNPHWGYAQIKDALVACQKFCTMQNQQSKQRQTPFFDSDRCFSIDLKNHDMILIIEEDNR
jgi:hypothetical protein